MNINKYKLCVVISTTVLAILINAGTCLAFTPIIDSITPDSGSNASTTNVTITGSNFEQGAHVSLFGGGPYIKGSIDTTGLTSATGVYFSGSYAYVADGESGLQVIDISTPASQAIIGSVNTPISANTPGKTMGVHVSDNYAYVAGYGIYGSVFQVIDISTPSSPEIVGSVVLWISDIYVSGSYAYVTNGSGLQVIDISTPSSPAIIGSVDTPSEARGVHVSDSYTYVAFGYGGLTVIMTPVSLESNVDDSNTITAVIPANLPDAAYNIIVTNPGGEVGILHNGFRVGEDVKLPVITDIEIIDITDTSATVTWNTDESSDSVVEFGTASSNYIYSIADPSLATSHRVELTDLTAETTYYLIVKSTDSSGNTSQSEEHSFTTEKAEGCFINTASEEN